MCGGERDSLCQCWRFDDLLREAFLGESDGAIDIVMFHENAQEARDIIFLLQIHFALRAKSVHDFIDIFLLG